jgi:hypothetical protein
VNSSRTTAARAYASDVATVREAVSGGANAIVLTLLTGIAIWSATELTIRGADHQSTRNSQWVALAFCVAVFLRLLILTAKAEVDFSHCAFYVFVFVWMALAPFAQLAFEAVPIEITFDLGNYMTGLQLVAVGVIAYEIGYSKLGTRRSGNLPGRPKVWRLDKNRVQLLTVCGLSVVAMLAMYVGGPRVLFSSRYTFSLAVFGTSGSNPTGAVVNALLLVIPFAAALGWLALWRIGGVESTRDRTLLWSAMIANVVVNNPLSQSRFWVATVYLSLAGFVFAPRYPGFTRLAVLMSMFFLIIVFPFSGVFRIEGGSKAIQIEDPLKQLAVAGDYDAFPQLTASEVYVEAEGVQYGKQLTGALGFFIPRSVWPDKAQDTGKLFGLANQLGNVNLSAPLWAEGYTDFGFLGTATYLFGLGRLWRRLTHFQCAPAIRDGFACLLGVYQFVLLRGSLLQAMGITLGLFFAVRFLMKPIDFDAADIEDLLP